MYAAKIISFRIAIPLFVVTALFHVTGATGAAQETVLSSQTMEADFASNQDIPLGMVAGDSTRPDLLTLQQIRFETAYGNAWKVMGRLQWDATESAYWRITIALMDRQGRVLKHVFDSPAHIITVKGNKRDQQPFCAELELATMHFERRFHAHRFRLCLERLKPQEQVDGGPAMILTACDGQSQAPLTRAVLQVRRFDRSASSQRVRRLYGMDLEGRARFSYTHSRSMSLDLQIHCPGHASVSKRFSGRETIPAEYDVLLPPAGPVAGTVLNETNQPVPEVWITVQTHQTLEAGYCSLYRAVKTDPQGKWEFAGMPKDAERIDLRFKHPDYREEHSRFTGLQTGHRQVLKPGLPVRGIVYDGKGTALPDAVVHILPMGYGGYQDNYMHVLTDDQGKFSFRCARDDMTHIQSEKGMALLLVEVPGYMPTIKQIKAGPNTPEVDIRLAVGGSVSGQVLDKQGNPVPDAWTVVYPLPEQYKEYGLRMDYTDAQGGFTFKHVPKRFLLTVGKQGCMTVRRLSFPPETGEPIVRMTPAIHLTGKVTDATTGKSIDTFELSLCPVDDNGQPKQQRYQRWEPMQQGSFEKTLDESFPGKCVIMIRANGYRPGTSPSFGMQQGDQTLDFALTPDPSYKIAQPQQPQKQVVKGIVLTPEKTRAANVSIYTYGRHAPDTASAADGTFKLVFPPSSRQGEACIIMARDQENMLAAAVDSFDPTQLLQVQLESGVTFRGKVLDPQGNGLPQARISLYLWHANSGYGKPENISIQEDGSFVIAAVPRYQRYSVDIKASGFGSDYVRVETMDEVSQIQLDPLVLKVADQSVAGVVVDQEDHPISEIRIYAHGKGQPHLYAKTDQQGRFIVEGLVAGPVALQANMSGERRMHGRAQVQAGDQQVKIIAEERDQQGRRVPPKPKSLLSSAIPNWESLDLSTKTDIPPDKPLLICFWDMEQRPSRRLVTQLAQQAQTLNGHDVKTVLIQVTEIEQETLDQWLSRYEIPFRRCCLKGGFEKVKRQWGVQSLPWLVLTDKQHVVRVEGFGINELETKIQALGSQ